MKLFYRGVSYNYNPQAPKNTSSEVAEHIPGVHTLSYRGANYSLDTSRAPVALDLHPIANLIYRGTNYSVNGWTAPKATVAAPVNRTARVSIVASNAAATHHDNLYRSVQHRLEVARKQGDQTLIGLLERELQQIA